MRRRRRVRLPSRPLVAVAVLAAVGALTWMVVDGHDPSPTLATAERDWAPLPRTVEVEVLNAGDVGGAARDLSLRLRRAGLDVVYWGNAPAVLRDTVVRPPRVIVRRGDTTGAGRIVEVLGGGEVVLEPDSLRAVDLTVVLWREPTSTP